MFESLLSSALSESAMSDRADRDAAATFMDVWRCDIFPQIQSDYEDLLLTMPLRMQERQQESKKKKDKKENESKKEKKDKKKDKRDQKESEGQEEEEEEGEEEGAEANASAGVVQRKMQEVMAVVRAKSERRNVYMNLAYTGPVDNTGLQGNLPYDKVANMALDMFCDTSKAASAGNAHVSSTDAAADTGDTEKIVEPQESLREVMDAPKKRKPWKIPALVERGFEIPICITDTYAIPELGKFPRLGMDVVVNAVWLALFWAKKEESNEAVSALRNLILEWPMDFVFISGSTPEEIEENKFKWSVNMSAKVERLRDFVGLENNNMLRIVAAAAGFVAGSALKNLANNKKASAPLVHKWLTKHVRWGAFQCPDVATVERHMANWGAIQKNKRALDLMEAATQRWGRNNLLDWPTKLAIIVSKTDAKSLSYVVEALYTQMWRKNAPDPYGAVELRRVIPEILWVRSYVQAFVRQYSEVLKAASAGEAATVRLVNHFLNSPLAFFMKTESPERDPTWLQSLPTEALRCFMKHVLDLSQGLYASEIKGALANTSADRFSVEKFNKGTRVNLRFTTKFSVAYDSIVGNPQAAESADAGEVEDGPTDDSAAQKAMEIAGSNKKDNQAEKHKQDGKETELSAFRTQCEKHCLRELEARLVPLVAEGTHVEIKANVTSTRLYQNLTESVPLMAFYDVKNAKLCKIFEGEGTEMFSKWLPTSRSKLGQRVHNVSNVSF